MKTMETKIEDTGLGSCTGKYSLQKQKVMSQRKGNSD